MTTAFVLLMVTQVPVYSAMTQEASTLYQEACTLEYQHDYQKAVDKVLAAINLSPDDAMLFTKLAGLYTDLDKYDNAIEAYKKVIELRPNDAFVYISLGSIYELQSKYNEALDAYNNALKIFPEYKYNYLNIANVQYQMKNYKDAIENYNIFLNTYSQHWEARKSIANAYLADGKPEKAIVEFDNLYVNNNQHFDDYANYGIALFETQNYDKATEFLEKAVAKDADNMTAKVSLALSYQALDKDELALAQYSEIFKKEENLHSLRFDYGNLLADMSKDDEAIVEYKKYAEFFPNDSRVFKNLGIVYQRKKDYVNAIANYEKALSLDANDVDMKKSLAACYHFQKNYANSIKYYDEVLVSNPDDIEVKTNKAIALHAMEKYEDAIALYNEILSVENSSVVQNNLTNALVSLGNKELEKQNYSLATDTFIKAISRGTKDSAAYFGLARAYRACKVNDKAGEYYEKAIAMSPDKTQYSNEYAEFISEINAASALDKTSSGTEIQSVTLTEENSSQIAPANIKTEEQEAKIQKNKELIALGDENYKAKKYEDSLSNYKEALVLNPADEVTLLKIGNVYKLQNDEEKAIDFYKKAIFVNPEYADGWFNLGLIYANDKNVAESKKCFEKVLGINNEYAYAYYALAVAYETEKNNSEAVKNYELFLKYNKDKNAVEAVQNRIKSLNK